MATIILAALTWLALGVLAYAYVVYPWVVSAAARLWAKPCAAADIEPTVTLLIPAHNEEAVIEAKIRNALSLDYPAGKLQIRVVSDGSTDSTDAVARRFAPSVEYQRISPRGGKPNAVNQAVPFARGEILLLCDANTMFAADAVRRLVRHFADERVGAVSGDVRLASQTVTYGRGESLFWRLERRMQAAEAALGSSIGVDGGMYAVRRSLYVANRVDTLIDDFVIAMNVAKSGRRVLLDGSAWATEDAVADPSQEFRRRARTVAGGFQTLFEGRGRPGLRRPGLWAAYVSHKVLRWLGPVWLAAAFVGSAGAAVLGWLADWPTWPIYAGLAAAQMSMYALAAAGHAMRRRHLPRLLCLPYYFCLANAAAAAGFWRWLRKRQPVTWAQADRSVATTTDVVAERDAGVSPACLAGILPASGGEVRLMFSSGHAYGTHNAGGTPASRSAPASVAMLVTNRGIDDPRVRLEAAALCAAGRYRVTVVGWDRDTDRDMHETRDGVEFRRLALRSTHARGAWQAVFLGGFFLRAWPHLRALKPAAIHCHDFDTLPLGYAAARTWRAKLVFDAHENYPDMMLGHLPDALVGRLRQAERFFVPRADALITVGGRLAEFYSRLGARRVTIVGNWKDDGTYRISPSRRAEIRRRLGLNHHIAIAYIAVLGRDRHLEPLLRAVAADERFACVIGGDGHLAGVAAAYAREHANVRYLGAVPSADVPALTASCDVVYYGMDRDNPNSRWSAPNKLYEAIAAGMPMLAGDFGEVGPTIRQHGCGVLAATESAAAVAAALDQLADRHALASMAQAAKALAPHYSATSAQAAVVDAYDRLFSWHVGEQKPPVQGNQATSHQPLATRGCAA
ncbi:MAG: glycosyltransferase [Phycisphaerae bacterium]|nr:glycosyltransferase [Phycisphaerae bacterium]